MFKNLFKNTVENSSVKNENQTFESENDIEKYNNRGHYNNNYKSNQQNQNPEKIIKTVMTALMRVTTVERRLKKSRIISKCISTTLTTAKKQKLL